MGGGPYSANADVRKLIFLITLTWLSVLKGYRIGMSLSAATLIGVLLRLTPRHFTVPETNTLQTVVAPIDLLAGLAVAILSLLTAPEPAPQLSLTAPRDWQRLRIARLAGVCIWCCMCLIVAVPDQAAVAVSTTAALTGEGLLVAAINSRVGWLAPIAHVGAAMVFGTSVRGKVQWWAWILQPSPSLGDVCLGLVMFYLAVRLWSGRVNEAQ